jgi:hypothetical protein
MAMAMAMAMVRIMDITRKTVHRDWASSGAFLDCCVGFDFFFFQLH